MPLTQQGSPASPRGRESTTRLARRLGPAAQRFKREVAAPEERARPQALDGERPLKERLRSEAARWAPRLAGHRQQPQQRARLGRACVVQLAPVAAQDQLATHDEAAAHAPHSRGAKSLAA
jgi:hypothetical protein